MKILVTGGAGMLGRTLVSSLHDHAVVGVDRADGDLTDGSVAFQLVAAHCPDIVIHCAAMTAVDLCETNPEEAFQGNVVATEQVARATASRGARLIVISTDYVFDGTAGRPYRENDTPNPQTVYGRTKLEAECRARELCPPALIVRVAWLYGPGGPSFVHTMLNLASTDGPPVSVVNDQRGNPTSTKAVARALTNLIDEDVEGIVHLTNEGDATWYDVASRVFTFAASHRIVQPCTTAEFPRPAPRPPDSRLDNSVLRLRRLPPMPAWEEALDDFLANHPRG